MIKWIKENVPFVYEIDRFIKRMVLKLMKKNLKRYDRKRNTNSGV